VIALEDEKAYAAANREMKLLRQVGIKAGSHIMVAHHTPKKGRTALGTQAFGGSTEHNFLVVRGTNNVRKFEYLEGRGGTLIDNEVIVYNPETGEVTLHGAESPHERTERQVADRLPDVVACVREAQLAKEQCNAERIKTQVGGNRTVVIKAIQLAVTRGEIKERPGKGDGKLYTLPLEG
jgi:hypothetical protein